MVRERDRQRQPARAQRLVYGVIKKGNVEPFVEVNVLGSPGNEHIEPEDMQSDPPCIGTADRRQAADRGPGRIPFRACDAAIRAAVGHNAPR